MSRVLVLDKDNISVGQFDAICMLGWKLNGHPSVAGGGSTQIQIPDSVVEEAWFQFGRMVIVQPADLPAYVGMIDTPWKASSPVTMTVYDAEYLLNLRVPDAPSKFTGSVDKIFQQIFDVANALEDLQLRMGTVDEIDRTYREETLDSRPLWQQTQSLGLRSRTEFVFRAARDADDRWLIYVDLAQEMGIDTGSLLSDGANGNMTVTDAAVTGEIVNRMIGTNSASGPQSRLYTNALTNVSSIEMYRLRSRVVQWQDVTDPGTLTLNTQYALEAASSPKLSLTVNVKNVNHAFLNLRPGNRVLAHASKIHLPNGVRGWRGVMRITTMAFQEASKTVLLNLVGAL